MKKKYLIIPALFLSFCFLAFMAADHSIETILQKLQMTSEDAKEYAWSDCSGCYFSYPMPGDLKDTPLDERPAIVKAVGEFVKLYSKSDDFRNRYLEHRESSKPSPPQPPESMEETRRRQKAEMEKSIRDMEKAKADIPASQKADYEKILQALKQQMAEFEKPGNDAGSSEMGQYTQQAYEAEMQEYKDKLQEWEKEYPREPGMMIRRWLEEFLRVSADVDFGAELNTDESGKKKFVKSEYERKPELWKLCFRAGRQTTEAGREFAEEWLRELK